MTPPKISNQRYATVPVDDLLLHPRNPRRGDIERIAESLRANGFFGSIVVQSSTSHVIVGNHRLQAARLAGMTEVPVVYVDVDDRTALRIMLADNRTADVATNDNETLLALLHELAEGGSLQGSGYTDSETADLERLLGSLGSAASPIPPDEAWAGMPGYENTDLTSKFQTMVHFKTEEDADAFFALIGQKRTFSIWWPESDGHVGSYLKEQYVSEEREE